MSDMGTLRVADSNREQAEAWDGGEGAYWAAHARQFDDVVAAHHRRLMAALDVRPDSRALDIGCGTGQSTRDVARLAPAGWALGVDLSHRMIEVARRAASADGVQNVAFEQADAQIHPFDEAAFDLALGRTAAMFFGDKPAAFRNIARALRPGAQLALVVWQDAVRNEYFTAVMGALAAGRTLPPPPPEGPHPFSMADPARVRPMLESAGFGDVDFEAFAAPMNFGATVDEAYDFLLGLFGWLLDDLSESAAEGAQRALRASLEQHLGSDGVTYDSAAWLLTARRP